MNKEDAYKWVAIACTGITVSIAAVMVKSAWLSEDSDECYAEMAALDGPNKSWLEIAESLGKVEFDYGRGRGKHRKRRAELSAGRWGTGVYFYAWGEGANIEEASKQAAKRALALGAAWPKGSK